MQLFLLSFSPGQSLMLKILVQVVQIILFSLLFFAFVPMRTILVRETCRVSGRKQIIILFYFFAVVQAIQLSRRYFYLYKMGFP